jgi:hypothetical protein
MDYREDFFPFSFRFVISDDLNNSVDICDG